MEADDIKWYVYITSTVFFLLILAIYYIIYLYSKKQIGFHKNLEEIRKKNEASLLKATLLTQEKERERIGANLHDDIGPLLSSFKMYFKNELTSTDRPDKEEITSILTALDENIEQVRDFSRELIPSVLHQFGLKASLEELKRRIEKSSDIEIHLDVVENLKLEIEDALSLYRILQESINNAIRHGKAKNVEITIFENNMYYDLKVQDNGIGFDAKIKSRGLGLRNLEARSKSLGSTLTINSIPGKGTTILIKSIKKVSSD